MSKLLSRKVCRAFRPDLLGHPNAARWIILVALTLALPSLGTGLVADDHIHRLLLRDDTGIPGLEPRPDDLFVFATGDHQQMAALQDKGVFPWTTEPSLRLAFFRPLSVLTHRVDHALWPDSPWLMHLHNLAWFGALLGVLGALYRRVHDVPWVAGLALLLYALDDIHGPTFGWIANRQSIISATFGFAAVAAHMTWRQDGWRGGAVACPALLALSLLAGESGLAATAYLFAFAVALDSGRWTHRLAALVPSLVVALVWLAAYRASGYGASGSGVYVDPGGEPAVFAEQAGRFLPVLLVAQLTGLLSDIYAALPDGIAFYTWVGCLVYLVLFGDAMKAVLGARREARFWGLGMVLSALPSCSTVPADRLLIFVGVGAMGLIATFLHSPEGTAGQVSPLAIRRFSVRTWTIGLIATHLILGPLLMPIRARTMAAVADSLERTYTSMPLTPAVEHQTVVVINPPSDPFMAYIPLMRASRRDPIPGRQRWLAVGQSAITVLREDNRTLLVTPERGYMELPSEQLVRSPSLPIPLGYRIEVGGCAVEVTALTPDGRPAATRWRFELPLEDPSFVWLRWADDHLRLAPFVLPGVGESVTLPPVDGVRAFLGESNWPD